MFSSKKKNVVVIGGGSGSFAVLRALRDVKNLHITAVVTTMDSGGVAWWERANDMLPSSDFRKCFLALSTIKTSADLYRVFGHRFAGDKFGSPGDVSLGNLLIAAVFEELGLENGLVFLTQLLNLKDSTVIPVSTKTSTLKLELSDGTIIEHEHRLDEVDWDGSLPIVRGWIEPAQQATPLALKAIREADFIIFPPGDVYGSILPNLYVGGVVDAISNSNARLVAVVNLMTKYGQTHGWGVSKHVEVLEGELGRTIDVVLANNGPIHPSLLEAYEGEHASPVVLDLQGQRLVEANLVPQLIQARSNGDRIVRHHVETLRFELNRIL